MNMIKASEIKPVAGKPIILVVDTLEKFDSILDYFVNDGRILINFSGIIDIQLDYDVDHITGLARLNSEKIIIDIVADNDLYGVSDFAKNSEIPVYLARRLDDLDKMYHVEQLDGITAISDGYPLLKTIMGIFGWVKFPVFSPYREMKVREALECYIRRLTPLTGRATTASIDSRGHAIYRSDDPIIDLKSWEDVQEFAEEIGVSMREAEYIAFVGINYITLGKEDARAVATLLDQVVRERGGDDVKAFGDDGLSYERLHDRLTGLFYECSTAVHTPEINDPKAEGYHRSIIDVPLILENPAVDCDHEWTKEEWETICKLCNLPADKTSRIVLNINSMEHFIDTNMD